METKDIKQSAQPNQSLLNEFLSLVDEFPANFIEAALKQAKDEDERVVISGFSITLTNQLKELTTYVRETSSRASKSQLAETERLLKMSSGVSLVKDSKSLLSNLGSTVARIGLSQILTIIKKIIKTLLGDILGITLPKWVEPLLELIDEFFNAINSVGSTKLSNTLSKMEQNYLAEITQLAKLQKVRFSNGTEEEDEE